MINCDKLLYENVAGILKLHYHTLHHDDEPTCVGFKQKLSARECDWRAASVWYALHRQRLRPRQ